MTSSPARPKARIASLDVIRGFALLGVVAVNGPYFAAPLVGVINPALSPLGEGLGGGAWFITFVFFEFKSIALFSMLFGASLYLVGGERSDREKGRALRRRLGWLLLFGALHGALLWFGDILLSYAVGGFILLLMRSWSVRRLALVGVALFLISLAIIAWLSSSVLNLEGPAREAFIAQSWSPSAQAIDQDIARYRSGLLPAMGANFAAWIEFQIQTLLFLTPRTVALMMIGLALFKSGFLSGKLALRIYAATAAVGAIVLLALASDAAMLARDGWPMERVQGSSTLFMAAISPLVALAYASLLMLLIRASAWVWLTRGLANVGRMAFTNYIAQSLVLSTLFWSGRGFGLYGELDRMQVLLISLALFGVQIIGSSWWLKRFEAGPLEAIWRRLTYPRRATARAATAPINAHAIETKRLAKHFGKHIAVANAGLCVPARAVYGFLGPNGAGKTTTIRMLLGLLRPTDGEARIFGHDVSKDRLAASAQIGSLLEARACYDHLTARENLELSRRLLKLPKSEIERVLAIVDLDHAGNRKVGHFSLGMRQRLGLARAMLGAPPLLILDEPMNGLDPEGMADMRRLIRDLPDRTGVTVFLSSHLLSEVEHIASHVGIMRRGRLVAQGALGDLMQNARPDLWLRVDDTAKALGLLRGADLKAAAEAGAIVVSAHGGDEEAAHIVRTMAEAGIDVFEVRARSTGLEAFYARSLLEAEAA